MKLQVTLTLCVLIALFETSFSFDIIKATPKPEKPSDLEKAVQNVEAAFSEVYRSFVLLGDIIIMIPLKGTKLVGIESVKLVGDMKYAFTEIGEEVDKLGDLFEHFVMHDILDTGTGRVLSIIRSIRRTLQNIKKYLNSV